MHTIQPSVAMRNPEIAALLKFSDDRYVLPFNPLAGTMPILPPGNRPMPDPMPPMRF